MALVVDSERSERGQQRRRAGDGRILHACCICGKLDVWNDGWSTYCSWKEIDDEVPIPKFCSDKCREAGGSAARNVTAEMKRMAKDAEWREPTPVYREQTQREKYADAADLQRRKRAPQPPAQPAERQE
jgi:hypothetical protein